MMPEMDGFQFLEQFRQLPQCRRIPVIVWTAKDLSQDEFDRLRRSAQGVVAKNGNVATTLVEELKAFFSV
jgi:CheY-like chemotaxis protein